MDFHVLCMDRAICLGYQSLPISGVNPAVGAVLARNGTIIGEGFHHGPGTPHAEIEAITDAVRRSANPEITRGADLYCTLEPCCHEGAGKRTPPCTGAIIRAGIARVFVAQKDPNPRVQGGGLAILRSADIEVIEGLLAEKAYPLIAQFNTGLAANRPFIHLKWAQSLDGRIACRGGASKWITPDAARHEGHVLRSRHGAVLVGSGTIIADDPELTVRQVEGASFRQPIRIVMAGRSPMPLARRIFTHSALGSTLVLATPESPARQQCLDAGISVLEIPANKVGRPDLLVALQRLHALGLGSILVEGGGALLTAFLKAGLWDAATVFVAPVFLGSGIEAVGDLGILNPANADRFSAVNWSARDGYLRVDIKPAALVEHVNSGGH